MTGIAWRLARRELRGGLRGFRIFLGCLALGVAAIAAAGSLGAALDRALDEDARALLGGDLALRLSQRPATPGQEAFLRESGRVSHLVELRTMAFADQRRALVELKAVDPAYPLYGQLRLDPPGATLELRDGEWGAVADANLLSRLGLAVGDQVRVGEVRFRLRATIRREPDRVAGVLALGPRLMIDVGALAETGLLMPGSLASHLYRVATPEPAGLRDELKRRFPEAGWQMRESGEAAPGVRRFLDNVASFLSLVGLTALLVGGIGVAGAVSGFVEGRKPTIAMLKCVGATGATVFRVYALQVAVLATGGVALGLAAGAAIPWAVVALAADTLPVAARPGLYARPLALAGASGMLTAAAFALWPLARAAALPAAGLLRDAVAPVEARPGRLAMFGVAGLGLALAALAVGGAADAKLGAWFVGGAAVALAAFAGLAVAVRALARRLSRRLAAGGGGTALRLGLSGLHRPGAPTVGLALALGLGLSVLTAVAMVEANLSRQIGERMPERAPTFFFIDIQPDQADAFDAAIAGTSRGATRAPIVRGRIVRLNGVPVERATIAPEAEWAVRGDRGLTSAATPPEGTRIVAGEWWPADYQGPPLVSLDAGIARGFGLGLGDTVTANVLGREITATIASLREIEWTTLGMNFTFVLSPGALAGAPHTVIAAVHAAPGQDDALEREVTDRMPNVSAIRVREALESVLRTIASAAVAVRAAASVTLAAGVLVLAGAIAAGRRRRLYEAVVLKVLGATRGDLARAFLVEFGLMGLAAGGLAALIGSAAAWAVLTFVMRADFVFLPQVAALTAAGGAAAVAALGFAGTWGVLGARAAPWLRND